MEGGFHRLALIGVFHPNQAAIATSSWILKRLDLRRPYGARRRSVRHVLPIDAVEHIVFDAVVDQRMHLHEAVERGAGRLQQQLQVSENDVRLAGERAVAALAVPDRPAASRNRR